MKKLTTKSIVIFTKNLRIHDNLIISESIKHQSAEIQFICYVNFNEFNSHHKSCGLIRSKFLLESIQSLRTALKSYGHELHVILSNSFNFIESLIDRNCCTNVYMEKEFTSYEINMERKLKKILESNNANLLLIDGNRSLIHPNDLPFNCSTQSDMPNSFTPFRKAIEKSMVIRPMAQYSLETISSTEMITPYLSTPNIPSHIYLPTLQEFGFTEQDILQTSIIDSRSVLNFHGGETSGLERLQKWAFDDNNLKFYYDIRNGMLGEQYSSKLSAWLSLGCISSRMIYYEVKRYEEITGISNQNTYWLIFELIVRDYYYYLIRKQQNNNKIFQLNGICNIKRNWRIMNNETIELINKWKNGLTGIPLIDANMIELRLTGYISNRGRQNVASYLINDLNIDWRIGAQYFESMLIDNDVYSNYGNWNTLAGLTNNEGKINHFHSIIQSYEYDSFGSYIKCWLPQLTHIPVPLCYEPWKLTIEEQIEYKIQLNIDYIFPCFIPTEIKFDKTKIRNIGGGLKSKS